METKAAPLSTDLHKFSSRLQPPQAKQLDRAAEQGSPLRILPTDTDTALLPGWSLTQGVLHSRVGSLSHELAQPLSPSLPRWVCCLRFIVQGVYFLPVFPTQFFFAAEVRCDFVSMYFHRP